MVRLLRIFMILQMVKSNVCVDWGYDPHMVVINEQG